MTNHHDDPVPFAQCESCGAAEAAQQRNEETAEAPPDDESFCAACVGVPMAISAAAGASARHLANQRKRHEGYDPESQRFIKGPDDASGSTADRVRNIIFAVLLALSLGFAGTAVYRYLTCRRCKKKKRGGRGSKKSQN